QRLDVQAVSVADELHDVLLLERQAALFAVPFGGHGPLGLGEDAGPVVLDLLRLVVDEQRLRVAAAGDPGGGEGREGRVEIGTGEAQLARHRHGFLIPRNSWSLPLLVPVTSAWPKTFDSPALLNTSKLRCSDPFSCSTIQFAFLAAPSGLRKVHLTRFTGIG